MIYFEHQGVAIFNPFLSGCLCFAANPEQDYGFVAWSTGGGCEAWVKPLENGHQVRLTDRDGARLPASAADALIGYFDLEGNEIACHPVPSAAQIEALQNSRFSADWGPSASAATTDRKEVGLAFFTEAAGYSMADRAAIATLPIGRLWTCPERNEHTVMRIS